MNKLQSWSDKTINPPKADLAVVIGRFQPFHNGHLSILKTAAEISDNILVIIGSSFIARNIKNPFTFDERESMILAAAAGESIKGVHCAPVVDDLYNDQQWIVAVQNEIYNALSDFIDPNTARVVIVGHHKDDSSYYLDIFPKYTTFEVPLTQVLDSTTIRDIFFEKNMIPKDVMPFHIESFLRGFENSVEYKNLCDEYKFIKDYRAQWSHSPFPPVFSTTDAVVINNGHILLVKRRMAPGKGLWALPGGFVGVKERLKDSMLRELEEETRIKVSREHLRNHIRGEHTFDSPYRSERGRTITQAYLIVLNEPNLPKVRGGDDAERAKWFPISEFYQMSDKMYEDHYSIASYMINRA
jgi:bifunctional NMN adenylyltransferase/nudix hydrolase